MKATLIRAVPVLAAAAAFIVWASASHAQVKYYTGQTTSATSGGTPYKIIPPQYQQYTAPSTSGTTKTFTPQTTTSTSTSGTPTKPTTETSTAPAPSSGPTTTSTSTNTGTVGGGWLSLLRALGWGG